MNIALRNLKHVVVLARELNYTRAAQSLHITQSALSRSIQSTEHKMGLRLFDRDRGSVKLTAVGRIFVDRAAAIIREVEDFDRTMNNVVKGEETEVSFGMAPLPAKALLTAVLSRELAANSSLHSNVFVRSANALLLLLAEENIEFFLCAEEQMPASALVKAEPLGIFPLSLIVRAGHPLLGANPDSLVGNYPVVTPVAIPSTTNFPNYLQQHLKNPPQVVLEDFGLLSQITQQSDAVWPTCVFAISEEVHRGALVEIPPPAGEKNLQFQIMIYTLDRRSLSPAAQKLIARFRSEIKTLEKVHR